MVSGVDTKTRGDRVDVRLDSETIQQIDAIVEQRQAVDGRGAFSRSSLIRHWIERGIREDTRKR